MRIFCKLALAVLPFCLWAEKVTIGDWSIELNLQTGQWESLHYRKEFLLGKSSVRFHWLPQKTEVRLEKWNVDPAEKTLTLRYRAGDWLLKETASFDAHGMTGLLRRSHELEYQPAEPHGRAQFNSIRISWMAAKENEYWRPGAVLGDGRIWYQVAGDLNPSAAFRKVRNTHGFLKDLSPGYYADAPNTRIVVLRTPKKTAMLFLQDSRRDPVDVAIEKMKWGGSFIQQTIRAAGWAKAGTPQKRISSVYLAVVPETELLGALRNVMPEWYRKLNWTVPQDRPDWVYGASVYELRSRFGADQSLKRITRLIPRAAETGFDTLHVQPVQKGPNVYNPEDFFAIDPHCGTETDFQELVDLAHQFRMKVWLDIVPHGGFPHLVFRRNTPLSWLWFHRSGHFGHPYPCDYKNPDYQKYIHSVADHYMKRFKIDGFRIDQPFGSPTNWSTENFPPADKLPPSSWNTLTKEQWEKGLAALGGKMPPLPYERGSLAESEGGMEMVSQIRSAVKKNNPDGSIHSETLPPTFPQVADVVYDLNTWVKKIGHLEPEEFVPSLSRFLEEQKYIFPPETLFLRVFQNHDRLNPFPYLGTNMGRAAFAVNTLSFGCPITIQYSDIGQREFFRKLNRIRHSRPDLQKGEAHYLAVRSSEPAVWTVLREYAGKCAIGVVNFSSRKLKTRLSFPPEKAGLNAGRTYALNNLWNGREIIRGTPDRLADFELSLQPFEVAILSPEPTEKQEPQPPHTETGATIPQIPAVQEKGSLVSVSNNRYALTVDRKTGLPVRFGTPGKAGTGSWDFLTEKPLSCKLSDFSCRPDKSGVTIHSNLLIGNAPLTLTFRCSAEEIRVTCSGKIRGMRNLALILPLDHVTTWKVNAFDGLLEDAFHAPELQTSLYDINFGGEYRNKSQALMIWDQLSRMLNPLDAGIQLNGRDGGFALILPSMLSSQPANIALLKAIGDSRKPALQLSLRDYSPLAADAPETASFILKPSTAAAEPKQSAGIRLNGLALSCDSAWYTIENDHYLLTLDRLSGTIRTLKEKKSNRVILENQLTGGYGFTNAKSSGGSEHAWINSSFTRFDPDATARFQEKDGVLHMRFLAQLHGGRSSHPYPRHRLWTITEYAFDKTGSFRCSIHTLSETGSFWKDRLHEWVAFIPEWITGKKNHAAITLFDRDTGKQLGTADFGNSGKLLLNKDEIHAPIFTSDSPFRPREYVSRSIRFSVGQASAEPPATTAPSQFADAILTADPSFSRNMRATLLMRKKSIIYPSADVPGMWVSVNRGLACWDTGSDSADGASLKLDKNIVLHVPLAGKELEPGTYDLTFSAKAVRQKKNQPYSIGLSGAAPDTGNIITQTKPLQFPEGDSAWKTYTVRFSLKGKLLAPAAYFQLSDRYEYTAGTLWIDNVTISPVPTLKK